MYSLLHLVSGYTLFFTISLNFQNSVTGTTKLARHYWDKKSEHNSMHMHMHSPDSPTTWTWNFCMNGTEVWVVIKGEYIYEAKSGRDKVLGCKVRRPSLTHQDLIKSCVSWGLPCKHVMFGHLQILLSRWNQDWDSGLDNDKRLAVCPPTVGCVSMAVERPLFWSLFQRRLHYNPRKLRCIRGYSCRKVLNNQVWVYALRQVRQWSNVALISTRIVVW